MHLYIFSKNPHCKKTLIKPLAADHPKVSPNHPRQPPTLGQSHSGCMYLAPGDQSPGGEAKEENFD